jgi:hypothetical protein
MDAYQLVASIVQSVASTVWPVAIFGSVFLFRRHLIALLPLLRLKHRDLEISFRLDRAEGEAAALPTPPAIQEALPTPEERSGFEQIADASPRAAILEVRAEIEEAVRSFARSRGVPVQGFQSLLGLTRILRSSGAIDSNISSLLDDLRVVGNNAAHDPGTMVSRAEALRYRALADQIIAQLQVN